MPRRSGRSGSGESSAPETLASSPALTAISTTCKEDLLAESELVQSAAEGPAVYQVRLRQTLLDEENSVRQLELGSENGVQPPEKRKVVMVLGATGSGKTTLLNALINFIAGVEWADNYRFRLINEEASEQDQAVSQTNWVTAYVVHWRAGFNIPFTLVMVDTPGYGDTRGIERDRKITNQIRHFFGTASSSGLVQQIDAVGFTVQAALARLTPPQQFIFDSILALFGKDISENVVVLSTFSDAIEPPVVAALKAGLVPYSKLLKFNNSAVYVDNAVESDGEDQSDDEGASNSKFNRMFWDMSMKSFKNFARALDTLPAKDLEMTRQVLTERENIELQVAGISQQVRLGLAKLETIRQEVLIVKGHALDIDKNKDFVYTIKQSRMVQKPLPDGIFTTTCLKCNFTCHANCQISVDAEREGCIAMDHSGRCSVCPDKCHWTEHKNMPYKLIIEEEEVTRTSADLKAKYEKAKKMKLSQEGLLNAQFEEFERIQAAVLKMTNDVRQGLERLSQIALRDDPLSHEDYIRLLIQSEQQEAKPGWKHRVEQLYALLSQAIRMGEIKDVGYDPFREYRKDEKPPPFVQEMLDGLKEGLISFLDIKDFIPSKPKT